MSKERDERTPDVCDLTNRAQQLVRRATGKVLTKQVADRIVGHLKNVRSAVKVAYDRVPEPERIRRSVEARRRCTDANAKARAKRLGCEVVEDVSIDEVRRRDNETCHLCGEWVSVHEQSLDHVIPLSKGGAHTYDNIKLAHGLCNSRKGDRLMSEIDLTEFQSCQ